MLACISFNPSRSTFYRNTDEQRACYFYNHSTPFNISIDPSFSDYERRQFTTALPSLRGLSLNYNVVPSFHSHIDLYVRLWRNPKIGSNAIGLYPPHSNYILIDPEGISTENQMKTIVVHEIGHWLGMRHLCLTNRDVNKYDCFTEVGFGIGVMNPVIDREAQNTFSQLDISNFHSVLREEGCFSAE
jgi:hypothetical protein